MCVCVCVCQTRNQFIDKSAYECSISLLAYKGNKVSL